ncbi:liporeleasing system, transmembrane, LolC/E family protein [Ehrlichia chaffeensis str. Heartland]|uniref:Lipoprotein releasing system transmembrane protein, LolC/E family n=1 Tax=Ehrlichia chaffeensis (strain ATCC CRL-10679 / Arkansas) TaxID=205920 RepID=Q2GHX8_EHRCR|nr:lipoprotein-releasing ABC transporter permease subunit [Ehrlichia chaffeensis]ABD44979.1 lipoprotein releasing system transmembrane protein, LolC/E family [Ehrlichia chaffeensis str. Arkansas]AHX04077.1 liporeleasing system, transmembrane, LolC/E family protein [Ehrlichia chaffeensis str. Heartland]AHX06010.1 liporeleasing system, transmembrane, LolC/E family protein [Ehrlichia chaffeensis str. Jax]AHX07000.1 liporeleasing system, transmembrane, LolC/E family protein [Ehrlichia chaffeensis s
MLLKFELMLALRYLRSSSSKFLCSMITMLSLVGITLGVATLIVVMSVMNGFGEKLLNCVVGLNGHIVIYFNDSVDYDYRSIAESIKGISGVKDAVPITENQAMIKSNSNVSGVVVRGIEKQDIERNNIIVNNIVRGSIDEFNDGIAIGIKLAEILHVNYGDKLTIVSSESISTVIGNIPRMKTYKIAAVFDVGMYEYDSTLVYMPLHASQLFFHYDNRVKSIEVSILDVNKSSEMLEIIESKTNMKGEDWKMQQGSYFHALKIESNVMFFILTLIIIVATFNIISSLSILVQDKKGAIAIMRTLGVTRCGILRIFCMCGFFIGLIGTILGCVLGIVVSLNIDGIKNMLEKISDSNIFDPVIYFFDTLPSVLLVEDVVKISLLSLFLSLVAAILPARKAACQDPADVLRHE